jgi:hypothetical protein
MNSLNFIRRVGKNCDEGQLAPLCMSVRLSVCMSILKNSAANGRVFMIAVIFQDRPRKIGKK